MGAATVEKHHWLSKPSSKDMDKSLLTTDWNRASPADRAYHRAMHGGSGKVKGGYYNNWFFDEMDARGGQLRIGPDALKEIMDEGESGFGGIED